MVVGIVKRSTVRRTRNGRSLVEVDIVDESRSVLRGTFFNQTWRAKQLKAGPNVVFFGKVDIYQGRRQMTNPIVDLIGDRTGRIVPIYPQSEKEGLTTLGGGRLDGGGARPGRRARRSGAGGLPRLA